MLLMVHGCFGGILDFCGYDVHDHNATIHRLLADYIKFSVNYKVDPCEDFYHFACGNWIRNTEGTPPFGGEISSLQKLDGKYRETQKQLLQSKTKSRSGAIQLAREFYHKCVSAELLWNYTKNPGINYVMQKINDFGVFPMLSEEVVDEEKLNASFDLTWLLAYFNQNKTVLHRIAPKLIFSVSMEQAEIS
ncbi:hypothetical protein GCK32_005880, partial [Trichostrongylus colubriformis]